MESGDGLPALDALEQRIIGSLLEKERTVPGSYPMTAKGLRTACNQSSSRDPIMELDEGTITRAIAALKARGLARIVHAGSGARTEKYRQVLDEKLELDDDERALLTVLLLRGPQAAGELKTRTERLHGFADREQVEARLAVMAGQDPPLVRELGRQAGQHDTRWVHLLGPVDLQAGASRESRSEVERESVIADGPVARDAKVVALYDAIAEDYGQRFLDELAAKPFDRWLLERVAGLATGGPVADVGCGPGHIAFFLGCAGAHVTGFDLSPAMVAEARRAFPDLEVEVGDLTALPALPGSPEGWAAITAWYSLVHLAGSELRPAIGLLAAALRPGGWLAVALHAGDGVRHLDDWHGRTVDADFVLHDRAALVEAFVTAGFTDLEWYLRGPTGPETTDRIYVLGRLAPT